MSSHLVNPEVIIGLARAAKDLRGDYFDSREQYTWESLALSLAEENRTSVAYRYGKAAVAAECAEHEARLDRAIAKVKEDSPMMGVIEVVNPFSGTSAVQWLKTIDYLECQSCDHWKSPLYHGKLFSQLRIAFIAQLPGYETAYWGGPGGE